MKNKIKVRPKENMILKAGEKHKVSVWHNKVYMVEIGEICKLYYNNFIILSIERDMFNNWFYPVG